MPDRAPQPVDRQLPTDEARDLISLVRDIAQREIAPKAAEEEDAGHFPREVLTLLSESGLLGLPYDSEYGGGDQPYEVYLQVLEELAAARLTVGLGVSVHTLACHALANYGTKAQQVEHLPDMLGGGLLGAYCLSEPSSGSDAASLRTKAVRDDGGTSRPSGAESGGDWVITGTKAWITHGGVADFYTVLARTGGEGARGITAFLVPGDAEGLSAAVPEKKMGMKGSPTAQIHFDGVRIPADRRIGDEGQGFAIALSALDSGRLGIAACAIGVAQAALDEAVAYATGRQQFGRPIADFQGLRFMLADMATQIEAGPGALPRRGPAARRGSAVRQAGGHGEAALHRHRDEGHHGRRPGARRVRLHRGLPRGALHARGQGAADRRGHQSDPADGHRPSPRGSRVPLNLPYPYITEGAASRAHSGSWRPGRVRPRSAQVRIRAR
jgi:alkylation response protein AidB-like acyl-CoA dehydrogenase